MLDKIICRPLIAIKFHVSSSRVFDLFAVLLRGGNLFSFLEIPNLAVAFFLFSSLFNMFCLLFPFLASDLLTALTELALLDYRFSFDFV